ncbi:MepB family protein [Staphylococcus sp. SQ8-PEA]|uniref:MepB family protein n=1 Tax=Staphylococcus marylandisciuri TaxID=2981529 RepID=A0ABT2QSQ2_9STAP|nr:MepB family protein [Staphylococcus marylandisciuri]MCU5746995.1 MepB family protein [Staphylococcus marylandisciuri]
MNNTYISKKLVSSTINTISNLALTNFKIDNLNFDYEGFTFELDKLTFKSRLAKKTPKKKGYFVAFWQKNESNENIPFDYDTIEDKLIINIIDNEKIGQFIFPKNILKEKGVITSNKSKGKMAMRVYPSWVSNLNTTAKGTQRWQTKYFVDLSNDFNQEKLYPLYFR